MKAKDFYETKGIPEGYNKKGTPIRVLVVDDEQLTRRLIIQVLKCVGLGLGRYWHPPIPMCLLGAGGLPRLLSHYNAISHKCADI